MTFIQKVQKLIKMKKQPKLQPVICGIDIGSWTVKIGSYDGSKFDILTNQANFRQTPCLVAFTPSERMIGQPANTKLKTNFSNTIRSPMRLIGLGKNPHFVQEELKYSTVNYELDESICFLVKQSQTEVKMQPQQLLLALMSKVKEIVNQHNFSIYCSYIAIPSYLSNSERLSVRKCAQVIKLGQVHLVDDWVAIAAQYFYSRIKQLQQSLNQKDVIFIDVGYSKFSIYAVRFLQDRCHLLDYEHLKHTGSKNMDNYLTQFYDDMFYKKTGQQKIITNAKALVKLKEMIEKQRKILSANVQHYMNIQYIVNEQDLSYNMKREEFQNIIMPVLSQMAAALSNIKSRVQPKIQFSKDYLKNLSIQLIGGASRIPLIPKIVSQIFGIEASRTLNSSEAMARGASIYGAIDTGFITMPYEISLQNFAAVSAVWNSVKNENYLGENSKAYQNKKVIFDFGCRYPCQTMLNFGPEGIVEIYVYYQHQIASQSIGYIRVNTPNKVVFVFDKDKVISVKCLVGGFITYNFHEIKEEKWLKMEKIEKQLQQNDKRITTIYNMKNQYESQIYKIKDKITNEWQNFSLKEEQKNILEMLNECQKWIEIQNNKQSHSDLDVKEYTERIQGLNGIMEMMRNRQKVYENIDPEYRKFIDLAKSKQLKSPLAREELEKIVNEIDKLYQRMSENLFETEDLTVDMIRQASRKLSRIF